MVHSRSPAKDKTSRKRKFEPPPLEVGQRVGAHFPNMPKRHWFPGIVDRINEDDTVAIRYDDGDRQEQVLRKDVRPSKTEAPPPSPLGRSDPTRREVFTPIRLEGSVLREPYYGSNGYAARQGGEQGGSRLPRTRKAGRKVLGGVGRDDPSLPETMCELLPQLESPGDEMLQSASGPSVQVAEAAGEEEEDGVEEEEEEKDGEEVYHACAMHLPCMWT